MVLMAPAVSGWNDSQYLLDYYDEEDKLLESEEFGQVADLNYHTWILRDRNVDAVNQDVRELVMDMQLKSLMKGEPDSQSIEIEEEDNISKTKDIKIPTLIVIGDNDVEDFKNIAYFIQKEINSSKMIILENASHLANLECPEVFESILLEFFAEL